MIRLPPELLPLVYAVALLAAVLVLWLAGAWRRARRRRRERRGLFSCRLCAEWIRHGGPAELVRCPACGALNEPGRAVDL